MPEDGLPCSNNNDGDEKNDFFQNSASRPNCTNDSIPVLPFDLQPDPDDFMFTLRDDEGIYDLFDEPMINNGTVFA